MRDPPPIFKETPMTQSRAIEFTENNLDTIANTGVITRADAQALYESTVTLLTEERYFIIDYTDANGNVHDFDKTTELNIHSFLTLLEFKEDFTKESEKQIKG